jgi:hypothetical protein
MKEIPLTQGQVAIVDDEDYEKLSKHKWTALWRPTCRTFYATRAPSVNGRQRTTYMHREIMGAASGQKVDHKDFNGLHNWRDNLRLCTGAQNIQHQRKRRDCTTPYKGVSRRKSGYFHVEITANGTRIRMGSFTSAEDAAHAYDEAAVINHGQFAVTNFDDVVTGAMGKRRSEEQINKENGACRRGKQLSHNSSGYTGVSWQKDIGRYTAKIGIGRRRFYLGSFTDPITAARAYDAKARELFGEFALTNFQERTNDRIHQPEPHASAE